MACEFQNNLKTPKSTSINLIRKQIPSVPYLNNKSYEEYRALKHLHLLSIFFLV